MKKQDNIFILKREGGTMKEHHEQVRLIAWAKANEDEKTELRWLFAIPNGGKRDKVTGFKMKQEGVKSGVPDLCLPVPRRGYHGLYIEMKIQDGGVVSDNQKKWKKALEEQGYRVEICPGFEAARATLENYLS